MKNINNFDENYKNHVIFFMSIITIAILLFTVYIQYFKFSYMNVEYPMWRHVKNIIHTKSNNQLDLISLGDSRLKAGLKPNLMNNKSLNLAIGGGTSYEAYYILKTYLKNNPAPKQLLLSFAPFHMQGMDVFWNRTVKFDFIDYFYFRDLVNTSKNFKDNSLKKVIFRHNYIFYKLNVNNYILDFKRAKRQKKKNIKVMDYVKKNNGNHFFGTAEETLSNNGSKRYSNFNYSKVLDFYLNETIKLAQNAGIHVMYYTMPYNQASCDELQPTFKLEYDNYLKDLSKNTGITLLNNGINCKPNSYFGDSSHLYRGADAVSKDIINRINNIH